jgi:predicted Ser/Thr protein kinase
METKRICPSCRKTLPPDVPLGLCPECLIKSGFNTGTEPGEPAKPSGFVAPPVEELRKLFPQLELLELIGKGGMGAVYKARQPALDRLVALKILPPGAADDAGFAERFNREARALARLGHPHIVAVHDFGQASGQPFLIMEFVDGPNLRQVEQAGRLTPEQALEIVPQICEALQFAHSEGVVHRDIKPENILLDKKGRVKITDFGIAKIVGVPAGKVSLTGAKDLLGTPHYMAPEQVEKPSTVDHRADIYSLGVVFYELLTGELPLGKFQPPSKKVQVDVRLDEVVLHALEKEPERRYQHASQLKTDVETIAVSPSAGSSGCASVPSGDQSRLTLAATIQSMVKAPAIGLVITGVLNWIAIPLIVFVTAGVLAGKGDLVSPPLLLVPLSVLILSSVMILAGLKMKRLEAYPLAIVGSILAILVTPGNVIGLPLGIWALVVLCRREVREAFGKGYLSRLEMSAGAGQAAPRPDRFWRRFAVAVALVLAALMLIPVGLVLLGIALPAIQRAKNQPSLIVTGPVQEVTLNDLDKSRGNEALSFASGQLLSLPADFGQRTAEARAAWLDSNRVDLLVEFVSDRWGIMGRGMQFRDLPNEAWNWPQIEFGGQWPDGGMLEKREGREGAFYLLPTNAQPPLTFAFLTANGDHGVLQITGLFTNDPPGMKLRFKLAQMAGGGGGGGRAAAAAPDPVLILRDNMGLDLDRQSLVDFSRDSRPGPAQLQGVDVAWDNDAGGVLMSNPRSKARLLPLPDAHDLEQAAQLARHRRKLVEGSEDRGEAASKCRFFAVLTDQAGLAVLEIQEFAPTQAKVRWRMLDVPASASSTPDSPAPKPDQSASRKFVRLVADNAALTFEGQPTSWDAVAALLETVPDRKHTVLEFAVTSDQITVTQQNEWFHKAAALSRQYGFEYASFIGIHPLGSKGNFSARTQPR